MVSSCYFYLSVRVGRERKCVVFKRIMEIIIIRQNSVVIAYAKIENRIVNITQATKRSDFCFSIAVNINFYAVVIS